MPESDLDTDRDRDRDDGLLGAIVRLNLAVTQVLEGIAGSFGLAMADYLVLGVIRAAPDAASSPTAIAAVLGRTTGGMTLTIDRLEAAGLVRRSADQSDGRRVVVALTTRGQELALAVNAALHAWESGIRFDGDRREIARMIDSLTTAVDLHRVASAG